MTKAELMQNVKLKIMIQRGTAKMQVKLFVLRINKISGLKR